MDWSGCKQVGIRDMTVFVVVVVVVVVFVGFVVVIKADEDQS